MVPARLPGCWVRERLWWGVEGPVRKFLQYPRDQDGCGGVGSPPPASPSLALGAGRAWVLSSPVVLKTEGPETKSREEEMGREVQCSVFVSTLYQLSGLGQAA